jgi:hypothetical protein
MVLVHADIHIATSLRRSLHQQWPGTFPLFIRLRGEIIQFLNNHNPYTFTFRRLRRKLGLSNRTIAVLPDQFSHYVTSFIYTRQNQSGWCHPSDSCRFWDIYETILVWTSYSFPFLQSLKSVSPILFISILEVSMFHICHYAGASYVGLLDGAMHVWAVLYRATRTKILYMEGNHWNQGE